MIFPSSVVRILSSASGSGALPKPVKVLREQCWRYGK
jgi:hypothetical protein